MNITLAMTKGKTDAFIVEHRANQNTHKVTHLFVSPLHHQTAGDCDRIGGAIGSLTCLFSSGALRNRALITAMV